MSNSGGSSPFLERPQIDSAGADVVDKDELIQNLEYQLSMLKNEQELETLRLTSEYRNIEKQYQNNLETLENTLNTMQELYQTIESVQNESKEAKLAFEEVVTAQSSELETLRAENMVQKEEYEFLRKEYDLIATQAVNEKDDKKIQQEASQKLLEKYEAELEKNSLQIHSLQENLLERETSLMKLELKRNSNMYETTNTEEFQELGQVNKMLEEQIAFTKGLEQKNLLQADEIKRLRIQIDSQKNYQKLSLNAESKIGSLISEIDKLKEENVGLQSQLASWEAYEDEDKPEEIVRKLEVAQIEYNLARKECETLRSELAAVKEQNTQLAMERNQYMELQVRYEDSILNMKRLNYEVEQQKILSFEECKILRGQLQEYLDAENGEKKTGSTSYHNYEHMVDEYKTQTEDLTNELKKLNDQLVTQNTSNKRRKVSDLVSVNYSKRLSELQLENAKLSTECQKSNELVVILEEKLKKASKLQEKKIRILQMRDNPVSSSQFIKKSKLTLLQEENKDLFAIINNTNDVNGIKSIPRSVFDSISFDLQDAQDNALKLRKQHKRLKEMFNKKSLEFIDVANHLLGFKMEFQQDSRVKLFSCFKPEKYLMVDLAKNTLKSNLNTDFEDWDDLMQIWVQQRAQMPCFLAEITLRLWNLSEKKS